MFSAAMLLILGLGALLVPELRAEPATWVFSAVLIGLAVLRVTFVRPGHGAMQTARQVKFNRWLGYTSHDGTGERDVREKRGE